MTTPAQPTPVSSTGSSSAPNDGRVAASIDAWKRKLLDLSKRNRALNFRATRVSTVSIVDEHPAEIFRTLYLAGREMRFAAAEAPPVENPTADGIEAGEAGPADADLGSHGGPDAMADAAGRPEFVPYDAVALDDRHTDDVLQTSAVAEALDRSLRRLDEQARLAIEEQGVNT